MSKTRPMARQSRSVRAFRAAWIGCFAGSLLVAAWPAHSIQHEELLDPRQAFHLSATALDERNIEVRFDIADGYYMYRERFRFENASGKVLADLELPPGERKRDPFFGETEIYRRQVTVRVPWRAEDAARGRVKLKITSQGCADVGVCYASVEQVVEVRTSGTRDTR